MDYIKPSVSWFPFGDHDVIAASGDKNWNPEGDRRDPNPGRR